MFDICSCDYPVRIHDAITSGGSFSSTDSSGRTPLMVSITNGGNATTKAYIDVGSPLNTKDEMGETAMYKAAAYDNVVKLIMLIDAGASIHITDNNGRSPLHMAALFSSACVDVLIGAGAHIDEVDNFGNTPLRLTVFRGTMCAMHSLIKARASILSKRKIMSICYKRGNRQCLRMLQAYIAKQCKDDTYKRITSAVRERHDTSRKTLTMIPLPLVGGHVALYKMIVDYACPIE